MNSLIISFTVFSHVNTVLMMKSASIPKREPGEGWLAPTTDAVKLKMNKVGGGLQKKALENKRDRESGVFALQITKTKKKTETDEDTHRKHSLTTTRLADHI